MTWDFTSDHSALKSHAVGCPGGADAFGERRESEFTQSRRGELGVTAG